MSNNSKKEYDHDRYEQNKDEIKGRNKKYWDDHKDEINAKRREMSKQNNDVSRETAVNNNKRWYISDMVHVLEMIEDGKPVSKIASEVNRTENAVRNVMKRKKFKELKERNIIKK